MKFEYVKPESLALDYFPESYMCATSDRDSSLQDYYEDSENNFFSGL